MPLPTKRVLVFPGTSLVGLEVLESLRHLPGFEVHGAGADLEAGRKAGYARFDALPYLGEETFEVALRALIARSRIDVLYPANDLAIAALSELGSLDALVVNHPRQTVSVAASKIATHATFASAGIVPHRFLAPPETSDFPVFSKPDVGHSSLGTALVHDRAALDALVRSSKGFWSDHLVTDALVRDEVTVDCFSTVVQGLLYSDARTRDVAEGGVAVVTTDYDDVELTRLALLINDRLPFNGPWFFQAKRDRTGAFKLMEIGARLAGASGIRRAQGINFAQLAVLANEHRELAVYKSPFRFVSRRVGNRTEVASAERFGALYVDLDDTLILNGRINTVVEELVRHAKLLGIYVAVITRHRLDPAATLHYFGLDNVFDDVFHATAGQPKASFIRYRGNSVLVDDSFSERASTQSHGHILAVDASAASLLRRLFHDDA